MRETLEFVRDQMQQISLLAHHNGYDFNADPQGITLMEGEAFKRIEEALSSQPTVESDVFCHCGNKTESGEWCQMCIDGYRGEDTD